MSRLIEVSVNNNYVTFVTEGFQATYPLALGASAFTGFSVALIAYNAASQHEARSSGQHTVATTPHESFANQAEGAAAVVCGPMLGVMAVSVLTASALRVKRAWTQRGRADKKTSPVIDEASQLVPEHI